MILFDGVVLRPANRGDRAAGAGVAMLRLRGAAGRGQSGGDDPAELTVLSVHTNLELLRQSSLKPNRGPSRDPGILSLPATCHN